MNINYDKIGAKAVAILEHLDQKFPNISAAEVKRGLEYARKKVQDGSYTEEEFYAVQLALMYKVDPANNQQH